MVSGCPSAASAGSVPVRPLNRTGVIVVAGGELLPGGSEPPPEPLEHPARNRMMHVAQARIIVLLISSRKPRNTVAHSADRIAVNRALHFALRMRARPHKYTISDAFRQDAALRCRCMIIQNC
jgi:hypothetical protein